MKQNTVAYVLKGFPRLSETFIASEIFRLEQLGLNLRLLVIKPADEDNQHEIVGKINAPIQYLPATSSLSNTTLRSWLGLHLNDFALPLKWLIKTRPLRFAHAASAAAAQAVRARKGFFPRKIYTKEFLQAAWIAYELRDCPDVKHLHAHFCHGATTVTWLASLLTGLPFSFTAHAKDIYCEALNPAGLLKRKMRAAEFVVTCTDANRQHLQTVLTETPIHCLYHGLNAEFANLLNQIKQPPPAPTSLRALGVGRLVPKKGFDVLIEACRILHDRGVPVEAVIIGEHGEHEKDLRAQIQTLQLQDHVQLTGPMDQRGLFREYQKAGVFCLPCRVLENGDRDGLPNVLMEAMACGLPVITTSISGIPEIIKNDINGQLIPTDDPQALANAIQRISVDRQFSNKLAEAGRKTVSRKFDGDSSAAKLAALFRSSMEEA
ncbi:MAG TPA: glycosyltransferase family 4 protein [Pyrinomonadaceae bacterium]